MEISHHLAWQDCQRIPFADQHIGKIFPCYDNKHNLSFIRQNCGSLQFATILNNEQVVFPENIGLTIDSDENSYYLIEGHLKNSDNKLYSARLSFRVWLTSKIEIIFLFYKINYSINKFSEQLREIEPIYGVLSATTGLLFTVDARFCPRVGSE